jgi:hypothetical protein
MIALPGTFEVSRLHVGEFLLRFAGSADPVPTAYPLVAQVVAQVGIPSNGGILDDHGSSAGDARGECWAGVRKPVDTHWTHKA